MDYLKENISFKEKFNPKDRKHLLSGLLIFFLVLAIPLTVMLTLNNRDQRSRAAENKKVKTEEHITPVLLANDRLLAAGRGLKEDSKRKDKVNANIVPLLEKRNVDLEYLFEKEPHQAAAALLPDDILNTLHAIPNLKIEKKMTLTGTFNFLHEHDGNDFKKSTFQPQLITDQETIKIYTNGRLPNLKVGESITFIGYKLGDKVFIKAVENEAVEIKTNPSKVLGVTTGSVPVAVIMANFSDSTTLIDVERLKGVFTGNPGKDVVSYFKESSYGKLDVVPSFYGPYTLPGTAAASCGSSELANLANADVDFTQFRRIIYVYNCAGGAFAFSELDYNSPDGVVPNVSIIGVKFLASDNRFLYEPYIYAHEFAHTLGESYLGMSHGAFWYCPPVSNGFAPPAAFFDDYSCRSSEYADGWDVLGNYGNMHQLNPDHKSSPLFFDPGKFPTITNSGTYTLLPYETNGNGILALNIPRANTETSFTVEYRQPLGFDAGCPDCNAMKGASIRLNGYGDPGPGGGSDTNLIDSTPGSILSRGVWHDTDIEDGTWLPGQTFNDPETGISVAVLSVESSGLKVQVTTPAQTCTHNAPTYSVTNPNGSGKAGQTVNYSINFKNNDTSGCTANKFKVDASDKVLESIYFREYSRSFASPDEFTLAPGASTTITISVTSPLSIPVGNYSLESIGIRSNFLGVPRAVVSGLSYQVTAIADSIPPTAPTNLNTIVNGGIVNLTWDPSTDKNGVTGYKILINNSSLYLVETNKFTDYEASPNTSYTYSVQASDANGNLSPLVTKTVTTPAKTDIEPPTSPTLISATATDRTVTLNWVKGTDNVGVAGYIINGPVSRWGYVRVSADTNSLTISRLKTNEKLVFRIRAFDADGNFSDYYQNSSMAVVSTAKQGQIPPAAPFSFYSPSGTKNGVNLSWSPVPGVTKYRLYRNGDFLTTVTGTSYTDTALAAIDNAGALFSTYFIAAVDDNGNVSTPLPKNAAEVTFNLYNCLDCGGYWWTGQQGNLEWTGGSVVPTINMTGITNEQTVAETVNIDTSANDDVGVDNVQLYIDGELYAYDIAAPYNFSWDTTKTYNGKHWIYTMAFDGDGNYSSSQVMTVTINNPGNQLPTPTPTSTPSPLPGDTIKPTISITNPVNGALVARNTTITITANATDNVGVTKVEFSVGNTKCTDTTTPYTCRWKPGGKPGASYVITARAYDAAGNTSIHTITVKTK